MVMDTEDRERTISNKEKILRYLQARRYATNQQLRGIGGSRAMGRVHELKHEGYPISVRKLKGAIWEIRLNDKPLGRDAMHTATQKALF